MKTASRAVLCLCAGILITPPALLGADGTIFGVQSRRSSTFFPLFLRINDDSTIANPGSALFNLNEGIRGAAFRGATFYGIQRDIGVAENYLVTVEHTGTAFGARVGADHIGFPQVEGLANVGGELLAVSVDAAEKKTSLISIDCQSGIGTLIGVAPADVIIVALAYDPVAEKLYGAGVPSGGVTEPGLYTIDPQSAAMTRVGDLGTTLQSLAWSEDLGLIGAFDHLYQIDTTTGVATQIGATDYTSGRGTGEGIFNGVYALAGLGSAGQDAPFELSISELSSGQIQLTWPADRCSSYQVQASPSMRDGSWTDIGAVRQEESSTMTHVYSVQAGEARRFFRVKRTSP